jgi:membrane protein implicated in regulation of membrane protease activity
MGSLDMIFIACAVLGGILFFLQMILQFAGHNADAAAADVAMPHDISGTADASFKLLSFQGLTAFFMMFGLVGLAMHRQSGAGPAASAGVAVAAGAAAVWAISRILGSMMKLQSTGTMDPRNAIGQEGEVYANIPATGAGQVQVRVQNHLRIFDAISRAGEELKTGTRVRVVSLSGSRGLVVEKI